MRRQAAENFTLVQPVTEGRRTGRGHRDTHIRLTVKLLNTFAVLENAVGSRRFATGCFYSAGQYQGIYFLQMKCEENIEIMSLFFRKRLTLVLLWINFIKGLFSFKASVMCNWWPLLYRTDWHTPGYRGHAFVFVTRF